MIDKLILVPKNTTGKTIKNTVNTINGKIVPFTGSQMEFNKYLMRGTTIIPYKGYYIYVKYRENDYLIMSCLNRNILMEIIPFGNNIMNSYIIAEYLIDKDEFDELLTTVEWSLQSEIRRHELMNGNNGDYKIYNIRFYRDKEAQNIITLNNHENANVKTKKMAS